MRRGMRNRKINFRWLFTGSVLLLIVFSVVLMAGVFRVRKVEISGNSYYDEQEIKELVMDGHENSLYLLFFYDYLGGKEIPFVDDVELSMNSPGSIQIRVYEKKIIGYVQYMGANIYFDKDGTVVESSGRVLDGIPCIQGLKFKTLTLYQPLDVKNKKIFEVLRSMTQMMEKYELTPDAINLQNEGKKIVLTFADVRINLGTGDHMDEKMSLIKTLLPELEGKSGVLYMEEYTEETKNISFIKDKE